MAVPRWMFGVGVGLAAALALVVASTGSAAHQKSGATLKVAVVTDIGGLNDKGFNHLAYVGLQNAQAKLHVTGRVFISKSAADYVPNLSTAARQHYDLVIANGYLMGDALEQVANKFKSTNFAIIDYSPTFMKSKPKNVRGLIFSEQEAGYLVGVAAAFENKTGTVSSVGGQAVPAVVHYLAGYKAGAQKTKPGIKVLSGYSQDFNAQDKCKEIANNQIAGGSDAVFAAAGSCGLGALDAAKEKGVWGIGVDNDQSFLGTYILTSGTKKVDAAVYTTIQLLQAGKFKGGVDGDFNVKNGGVGFGKVSTKAPKRAALVAKLTAISKQIASGKIKPPVK